MDFLCISNFRRLYRFSIGFISGLLPGHGRVSMPYSSRNSVTERRLWQGALSCMKMRYPMPENHRFPGQRIKLRNLALLQYCFALHMALNEVQTAGTKQPWHTTPWSACDRYAYDDTVLSGAFSRHATDVLHLLVLALNDAHVATHHLYSTRSLCSKPANALGWKSIVTDTQQSTFRYWKIV